MLTGVPLFQAKVYGGQSWKKQEERTGSEKKDNAGREIEAEHPDATAKELKSMKLIAK